MSFKKTILQTGRIVSMTTRRDPSSKYL